MTPLPDSETSGSQSGIPRLQTIVAATDLSEASVPALRVAAELAVKWRSKLIIVHVIEPMTHDFDVLSENAVNEMLAETDKALREVASRLGTALGDQMMDLRVLEGRPIPQILKFVAEVRADVLVTGTHGNEGLTALVMGSTAERLIRRAPCSVLVVRSEFDDKDGFFHHPLVAVDFSDTSARAVRRGIEICQAFGIRKLGLLHVYEVPTRYLKEGLTPQDASERVREQAEAQAHEWLNQFSGEHSSVVLELTLQSGSPGKAVADYVETNETDLVLMGTHGRTESARLLLGSVTEKVMRTARVSLLAERSTGKQTDLLQALKEWFTGDA